MFKKLINKLDEAIVSSSGFAPLGVKEGVADFDTSDTPAEALPKKIKGPPKAIPLKAIRNVQKPVSPIGSVLHAASGKKRLNKLPGATESSVFGSLISEARSLIEGGGSRATKAARQDAMIKKTGGDKGWKSAIKGETPGFRKHLYRDKAKKTIGGPDEYSDKLHVKHMANVGWSSAKGAADAPLVRDALKKKFGK